MSWWELSTTTPKARKDHRCIWCGQYIHIGEKHVKHVGIWEGDFQSNRWHNECNEAANQIIKIEGEISFDPYSNSRPNELIQRYQFDTVQTTD